MSKILVSIIIPIYNVENYLKECIDSVTKQTLKNIEIISINDGSTDSSLAILEEYAQKDSRIKIISKENGGLSSARNAGIAVANGEYITFLDSDDYLTTDALQKLYNKAVAEQLDMLLFCAKSFSEKGFSSSDGKQYTYCPTSLTKTMSGTDFFITSINENNHIGTAPIKLFRTEFIKENNLKFIEGIFHEDEPFYYEAILAAKRVTKIPNQFYCRRYRSGSITAVNKTHKHIIGRLAAISRILDISKQNKFTNQLLSTTMDFVSILAYNLSSDYSRLSDIERSKLKSFPYEQQYLLFFLLGLTNDRKATIIEKSISYKIGFTITKPFRWLCK